MSDDALIRFLLLVPLLLLSLSVHECAHAWTANRLGDPTARLLGRITLHPLSHLDPMGSLFFVVSYFGSGGQMFFAWGKPVPVEPRNLREPRSGQILVSLAGPLSNVALAILFGLPIRLGLALELPPVVTMLLYAGVGLNVALAVFNLIPIYPLDGSHVLGNLLPPDLGRRYWEFMGNPVVPMLLFGLLMFRVFDPLLLPLYRLVTALAL